MLYAKIVSGAIAEERDFASAPPDMTRKGFVWLPVTIVDPGFDPATQVKSGPAIVIDAQSVTKTWTVRAKTAQEIDDDKAALAEAIDRVQFEIAFNHENRIRALEGKAAVTRAQFRAAIKVLV